MPTEDLPPRIADDARDKPMAPREAAWRGSPVPVDFEEHAARLSRRWRVAGASFLVITALLTATLVIGIMAGAGGGPTSALVLAIVILVGMVGASAWLLRIGRRGERLYGRANEP